MVRALVAPRALEPALAQKFKIDDDRRRESSRKRTFGDFRGDTAATTLVSELEYERCLRLFGDAFDKGNLSRLWPVAHAAQCCALERGKLFSP